MRNYTQLTRDDRHDIGALRSLGAGYREIGRLLGRSASTILREVRRNRYKTDGSYKARHAHSMSRGRRRSARQGTNFTHAQLRRVEQLLRQDFSPEQVSGYLKRHREFSISHESIYLHLLADRHAGGELYKLLRCRGKKLRRKRHGAHDSRGRLAGKRPLAARPPGATNRSRIGHWEIDTVMGSTRACILTLVERKTGYVMIGKLANRTVAETNRRLRKLIDRHPGRVRTITADNGCEFHGYAEIEESYGVEFYFAQPYHSWERGTNENTNENTNGLIRQCHPKGACLENLTQAACDRIADKLNDRPRKRHNFYNPAEKYLN